jgi:hypothetical protein
MKDENYQAEVRSDRAKTQTQTQTPKPNPKLAKTSNLQEKCPRPRI